MLTRVAGRLRDRYDVVTGISRLLALACLVGLVSVLPWLSGKDPALTILRATSSDREPTPEVLESIRRSIGIDGGPLHVIGHWLAGLTRGDLGRSWVSGAAVGPEAVDAFGVSLSLMAAALGVGLVIAAALVLPALRDGLRGRPRTRGGAVSAVLISLPEYLLAPILMLVLAVYLRILPPLGWGSPEKVIMPALSLGLPTGGYLGGLVSDAVTATFSERWVATWSTAGIRGRALAGAVLRRALTPLARQMALVVVALTGGAVAVEKIFAIPGLGRELLDAATAQDIPALQAQILLLLALALTAGIIAGVAGRLLMGQAAGACGLSAPPPVRHSGQAARIIAGVGAGLLAAMVAWGIGRDPYTVVADKLQDPSVALPLGSDSLGRDVLARVAHGAVSTVTSAVVVTVVCFAIALLVGLAPRAATGFIEVANAAPPVLAGLIVAGVSGPSATGAAIAVAGVGWAPLASHAAGLVAENRQRPDVLLAPVLGEGRVRIALTRIVPAVVGPLARHAALRLPGKALALAGLGFLGLGAQSPTPEWGLVLSDALPYIERAPWAVATPAAALVVLSVTAVAASRSARR
ncbi:ABC transporter permease subunit [Actinomyces naeslundii]|uniref:ABC transporter permease subunit n=1 Tax=Actinomyces naeslundii TaxID=1655 RepID=A0AA47IQA0_ACTNA|nr:ABC transporter permease subunit [Actinomyces naeslundii]OMG15945.1 ABC transporter permease [Actinomyces naeslundii]PKY94660.1 ABC transporter permease [Actinomyces naeslundii]WAL43144.1 ABC transporter permease subunit [Actinomyces naeslundii]